MKRQQKQKELYYALGKKVKNDKYEYIASKDARHTINGLTIYKGAAQLFDTKQEAEKYRMQHNLLNFEIITFDPQKVCLSEYGCDDCGWGGTCPRYPY